MIRNLPFADQPMQLVMKTIEILSARQPNFFSYFILVLQFRHPGIGIAPGAKSTGAKIIHSSQSVRFHCTQSVFVSKAP